MMDDIFLKVFQKGQGSGKKTIFSESGIFNLDKIEEECM